MIKNRHLYLFPSHLVSRMQCPIRPLGGAVNAVALFIRNHHKNTYTAEAWSNMGVNASDSVLF